ncbi:MAG: hypothetical protein K6G18_06355 [Treponema sp.]|nr:hypothetical protein [Treponema sp.]
MSETTGKTLGDVWRMAQFIGARNTLDSSDERIMLSLLLQRARKGKPLDIEGLEKRFGIAYTEFLKKVILRARRLLICFRDFIPYILDSLTKRDQQIINMLYGLDGNDWTSPGKVCKTLGITKKDIDHVEHKVLNRIMHGYELFKDEYLADQEEKKSKSATPTETGGI